MKKSHVFKLRNLALGIALTISSFSLFAQANGISSIALFPANSTPVDCQINGEFEMNFTWDGETSIIESINWDNSAATGPNGSAYLSIYHHNVLIWSGYPEEVAPQKHQFALSEVVFHKNESYTLRFDLSQVDVTVYENGTFPWRPGGGGPIEINHTDLSGMVDQPVDPDLIFPYFTINAVYNISVEENAWNAWSPFPNPANDLIRLPELSEETTVELISVNGTVVRSMEFSAGDQALEVSDIQSGMYILRMTSASGLTANHQVAIQ